MVLHRRHLLATMLSMALVGTWAPALHAQARGAEDAITGTWRFDATALRELAAGIGRAMASDLQPEQRRAAAVRLKEMEDKYAGLTHSNPAAARGMEAELRTARAAARALERDPEGYFGEQFLHRVGDPGHGLLVIGPDGALVYESVVAGALARGSGAWRREGDEVILATAMPGASADTGEFLILRGRLQGERLVMRHELTEEDLAALRDKPALRRAMQEARWVLVRQQS